MYVRTDICKYVGTYVRAYVCMYVEELHTEVAVIDSVERHAVEPTLVSKHARGRGWVEQRRPHVGGQMAIEQVAVEDRIHECHHTAHEHGKDQTAKQVHVHPERRVAGGADACDVDLGDDEHHRASQRVGDLYVYVCTYVRMYVHARACVCMCSMYVSAKETKIVATKFCGAVARDSEMQKM